jgi:hypothetical protein
MQGFGVAAKFVASFCFAALCAAGSAAQSQPDAQAGAQLGEQSALAGKQAQGANMQKSSELSPSGATRFIAGTLINAELTRSVDSKKVKQGDEVDARTVDDIKSTDGRLILPKGTKIVGHVTEASARGGGKTDASLGLVFDKAEPKDAQEIVLNAGLQAVGAPPSTFSSTQDTSQLPDNQPLGGSARGPGGGAPGISPGSGSGGSPQGTATGRNTGAAPNITGESSNSGQWNSNTHGVVGLNHLSLNAASGNGAPGSVITSTSKSVHLDGDTRLILVTHDVPSK